MSTLSIQPNAVVALNNCIRFGLGSSGSAIAYKLTGDGTQLTEVEQIPVTSGTHIFEATDDLQKIVKTKMPAVGASSIYEDTDIIKEFFLNYGDVTLVDCVATVNVGSTSPTYKVLGSRPSFYNQESLTSGAVILSDKPSKLNVNSGLNDFISVFAYSGTISVTVNVYSATGSLINSYNDSRGASSQVFVYPIGPGNAWFGMPSNAAYYDVIVGSRTIRFNIGGGISAECITAEELSYVELYFAEPLGAPGALGFSKVMTFSDVTSKIYEQTPVCGSSASVLAANYFSTRYDVTTGKAYRMETEIKASDGLDIYLDAIIQAPQHYVRFVLRDGSEALAKVNIVDGTYQTLNGTDDVVFSVAFTAHQKLKF